MLLATAAAAYFLIHQITQVKDLPAVFARVDWRWAFLALAGSAMSYVGAGLNLIGGFAQRLPLGLTAAVQLGGSFINRISPVKVGGMAVNVRYLQKQGLESSTAIGGVGLAIVAAAVGLAVVVRPARRLIRTTVLPEVEKAATTCARRCETRPPAVAVLPRLAAAEPRLHRRVVRVGPRLRLPGHLRRRRGRLPRRRNGCCRRPDAGRGRRRGSRLDRRLDGHRCPHRAGGPGGAGLPARHVLAAGAPGAGWPSPC
jgi:hypothetical protein